MKLKYPEHQEWIEQVLEIQLTALQEEYLYFLNCKEDQPHDFRHLGHQAGKTTDECFRIFILEVYKLLPWITE